jgi:hypothetical protein
LKNANCFGEKNWNYVKEDAEELNSGECGLTDGSIEGDWDMPSKEQMQGLGTDGQAPLVWTQPGAPFENVADGYWTKDGPYVNAYAIDITDGKLNFIEKYNTFRVWPVRQEN